MMGTNDSYRETHNKAMVEFDAKLRAECSKLGFGCRIMWDKQNPYKNGAYEFDFELNRYEGLPLSDGDNPAPQAPNKLRTFKGSYAISSIIFRDIEDFLPRLARELLSFLDKERREEFVMAQYEKLSEGARKLFHHACDENSATLESPSWLEEKGYFDELIATTLVHHYPNPMDVTIMPSGDGRLAQVLVKEGKTKKKGGDDALPNSNT